MHFNTCYEIIFNCNEIMNLRDLYNLFVRTLTLFNELEYLHVSIKYFYKIYMYPFFTHMKIYNYAPTEILTARHFDLFQCDMANLGMTNLGQVPVQVPVDRISFTWLPSVLASLILPSAIVLSPPPLISWERAGYWSPPSVLNVTCVQVL